jgi:hypothetical protein
LILIPLVHGDGTDERDMDTEACMLGLLGILY